MSDISYRHVLETKVPEGERMRSRPLVQKHGVQTIRQLIQELTRPPVIPDAVLAVRLTSAVYFNNQVITSVEWTLLGHGVSLTASGKPNALNSTLQIKPPTGKQTYDLSGVALLTYSHPVTGEKTQAQVDTFATIAGPRGSLIIEWADASREVSISLRVSSGVFYFQLEKIS